MNSTSDVPENIFRLLVPATDVTPPDIPSVELCGNHWVLTEWMPISEAPPYTCISYSWGSGKVDNIFEGGQLMSYRTIPAIEAAITAAQSPDIWLKALECNPRDEQKEAAKLSEALQAAQSIWIDEICMPPQGSARTKCLLNLGIIYSSSVQVLAVLSGSCDKLLRKDYAHEHMSADELFTLENEDWLARLWTLLEMTKSKKTLFITRGSSSALVLALDFLGNITTDTARYSDSNGFDRNELAMRFPILESLQASIAADRTAEFTGTERSVFQVMSEMQKRCTAREGDRIYAMIASITNLSSDRLDDAILHPAENFMRICEEKGDYSFIYCTAPRSDMLGRGWRPVADKLQPVLSGLLADGSGLSGCLKATHLQLDNMCRMTPNRLNPVAKSIGNFLHGNIATALLERLRQKGFTGCGEYLELENGYFFPQSSFTRSKDIFVVASPDVQWAQGAPGMLLRSNDTDINQFCDVGVFIGRLPKGGESINVG